MDGMSAPEDAPAAALISQLYQSLRQIAHRERARAGRPQTMQTTALISEIYVKFAHNPGWNSREHFLASAATAMRHVLVDAARSRMAAKRGSGVKAASFDEALGVADDRDDEVIRIDDALKELRALDTRLADVVECRFFAGYSEEETGRILGISDRTVRRDWIQAKAWLYRAISEAE